MESASEFLRVLQHESALSTAHRPLRLRLAHSERLADDVLLPQRIVGTESICGGIEYRVACIASSPRLELKELIALPAEIQIVTDRGQLRSLCGIITEVRGGDCDGALASYQLVIRDAMAIMERRVNSRIFRYQNELEIVQVLFDEWRHTNAVLAGAFEYELDPLFDQRQFPPRELVMQHNESDAAFVQRLLKRRGVSWYFRPGRSRNTAVDPAQEQVPAHTLVLFNDPNGLPQNAAGTVRYRRDLATEKRDTITSWNAARQLRPGSATRHSWDYKNPLGAHFMTTSARSTVDQGTNGNELALTLDDYLVEVPHVGNDGDDHWRLGQMRMNRHEFESKCFQGEGTVRDFCVGEFFTLAGHPEIDTHPPAERDFVITELHVAVQNNLPKELSAQVERLLAKNRWNQEMLDAFAASEQLEASEVRVHMSFTAVRRGVPIVPDYDPRVDLPQPQLQSAVVVGPPNEEVHCDALGRVKIRFPGMRAADHKHAHGAGASDSPADSAWVRVTTNWAGNGPGSQQQCGMLGLPRVGTEVLVSFLGGDPDKPIIVAQVFNQRGAPPALSRLGELPGNRYLSGARSREIGGQRGNQLRFDDTRGEISAQLASDHGTSELNLGWLTQPKHNGSGEPRGEGAELRSDKAVAVRGAQGVLISAQGSPGAEGTQLERDELIGLSGMLLSVLQKLDLLATENSEDEASKPHLEELVDKLRRWHEGSNMDGASGAKGGQPLVAVSAPAGIMVASQTNVAIGAETKVDIVSAGDTEVATGRNLFARAARGISMFAYELGLRLVTARGSVVVQAHQGNIEIRAGKQLDLVASECIRLQAPKVKVVAQDTQTDWESGTITQQSKGRYIVKSARIDQVGAGKGTPAGLNLPRSTLETDERIVLFDRQTCLPAKGVRYVARHEDGTRIEGTTDDQGRTDIVRSHAFGDIELRMVEDDEGKAPDGGEA